MKNRYTVSIVIFLVLFFLLKQAGIKTVEQGQDHSTDNKQISTAFQEQTSDLLVSGSGTVVKVLRDDLQGSKHQRFIVKIDKELTVLIAHNIDLAPRVTNLAQGDPVSFKGEYEWNKRGGVIHWTHHDPAGRHIGGWIKHQNILYQ